MPQSKELPKKWDGSLAYTGDAFEAVAKLLWIEVA